VGSEKLVGMSRQEEGSSGVAVVVAKAQIRISTGVVTTKHHSTECVKTPGRRVKSRERVKNSKERVRAQREQRESN
jgi:hypothetical protein